MASAVPCSILLGRTVLHALDTAPFLKSAFWSTKPFQSSSKQTSSPDARATNLATASIPHGPTAYPVSNVGLRDCQNLLRARSRDATNNPDPQFLPWNCADVRIRGSIQSVSNTTSVSYFVFDRSPAQARTIRHALATAGHWRNLPKSAVIIGKADERSISRRLRRPRGRPSTTAPASTKGDVLRRGSVSGSHPTAEQTRGQHHP